MTLLNSSTRSYQTISGSYVKHVDLDQSVSGHAVGSTLRKPCKARHKFDIRPGEDKRDEDRGQENDENGAQEVTSSFPSVSGRSKEFQLHTVIGEGKFSTVWRATHVPTNTTVAVKKVQIYEILCQKQRADCLNEVKLLQSLNHPNVVKYAAAFVENNELVIVLDFCYCGDLASLLKDRTAENAPLSERDIWSIFTQLCAAVAHMHEHRVMHRDIKPSNVVLSADGVARLGDLGLSRWFSSKTAHARSMVGTPYYMSPECIRGQPYEWSSDVWSLGCLLYELVTLRNPFFKDGLNYYTLGKLITSGTVDPLPASASPELTQLVGAMLQRDPTQRPSLSEVAAFAENARVNL